MSAPYFDFQRFRVWHDRCAMKVGTDGVLLGAWAEVEGRSRILDIGTGTGLIALMAAQRSEAAITGIEIDADAALQATDNVAASPFSSRITILREALQEHQAAVPYDCILSNPPFFEEELLPPDAARAAARNASTLPFATLVCHAARLLSTEGSLQVIVPANAVARFTAICAENAFALARRTDVLTKAGKDSKRSLLHFVRDPYPLLPVCDVLPLLAPDGSRSAEYAALTRDFYLRK